MENSIGGQVREYIAVGILSIAAVFGGVVTGVTFAAPADGWDPTAPAVEAPLHPTPIAPGPAGPAAPAAYQDNAPAC